MSVDYTLFSDFTLTPCERFLDQKRFLQLYTRPKAYKNYARVWKILKFVVVSPNAICTPDILVLPTFSMPASAVVRHENFSSDIRRDYAWIGYLLIDGVLYHRIPNDYGRMTETHCFFKNDIQHIGTKDVRRTVYPVGPSEINKKPEILSELIKLVAESL